NSRCARFARNVPRTLGGPHCNHPPAVVTTAGSWPLGGQFRLVVATEIEPAAILARRGAGRRGLRCGQGRPSLAPVDERLAVRVARLVVCISVGQPVRGVYLLYRPRKGAIGVLESPWRLACPSSSACVPPCACWVGSLPWPASTWTSRRVRSFSSRARTARARRRCCASSPGCTVCTRGRRTC